MKRLVKRMLQNIKMKDGSPINLDEINLKDHNCPTIAKVVANIILLMGNPLMVLTFMVIPVLMMRLSGELYQYGRIKASSLC